MARFQKGQSGNSKGRPAGKTPGAKIRAAIEKHKDSILQSVIDAAVKGDMQACKMLLDRICPPLKPQAAPVAVPLAESLTEQGGEVIKATLAGTLPPDVGAALITALSNQARIIETDELVKRIEALEKTSVQS